MSIETTSRLGTHASCVHSFSGRLADDFTPEAPAAETPFRIAVLGNFSGRSDRRLLKIDRENLDIDPWRSWDRARRSAAR